MIEKRWQNGEQFALPGDAALRAANADPPKGRVFPLNSVICLCAMLAMLALPSLAHGQTMQDINPDIQPPLKIDPQRVAENGLRVIQGEHVTIYTDLPSKGAIDELPKLFDAAVPQWCKYFNVKRKRAAPWKLQGFVIRDKQRFENAGLIPESLPEFPAGINRGHEFWVFAQPEDYYTRHLVLHEGTHAFMQWFGNGYGAPWYAEGMAELLALHRWKDGQLELAIDVTSTDEVPGWGRPKLIKDWIAANADGQKDKSLRDVLLVHGREFENVINYAWSWAVCEFLENHPLTKDQFGELQKNVTLATEPFNEAFLKLFAKDLDQLERDWAWYIREIDYGYRVARAAPIPLKPSAADKEGIYELRTDRSWQCLEQPVSAGQKFRVWAKGRFKIGSSEVAGTEKPWPCEANGITIDWFRGCPIGEVQAIVMPSDKNVAILPLICREKPVSIGNSGEIVADIDGRLCFRINESPANLDDNRGTLKLAIEKVD